MKNLNKEYLYVWACDFSNSRGEGLLARNFILNCSKHTKKKIYINGKIYSNLKNKNIHLKTNLFNDYFYPFLGIFKIWKEHFANKKTIYLNYLPLWNFFIFLLLPKNTVLGPITGGSNFTKSNSLNYYVRKYIFPILFFISLKIIKKKFSLIIFSTDLLRKYIKNDQKFIFNYCLNIYKNKFFKNKKVYDIIFYYRKNLNKNNFIQKKLIKKLIDNHYKVIIIGDDPLLNNSKYLDNFKYLGNLKRDRAFHYISKSRFAVNNNENMYSLFCLDALSCGTQVVYLGKKNSKNNFFNKNSIIQKEINNVDEQYLFIKKILDQKKTVKIQVNKNYLLNKKKFKNYFLKLKL